jgi:osmotically-inducible protein OsmY
MDADLKLRKRVIQELEWEPAVDATHLNVEIHDAVVTLTGTVRSYAEKRTADEAVKRVTGVRAVVEGIEVKLPDESRRDDAAIAQAAATALEWDVRVPQDRVVITVEQGSVTLDGDVDFQYQREAAERAVSGLTGVTRVLNNVRVVARVSSADVKGGVEAAFGRTAQLDARGIHVEAIGPEVILSGFVDAWRERAEAERIAWAAPGVSAVENGLTVRVPAAHVMRAYGRALDA